MDMKIAARKGCAEPGGPCVREWIRRPASSDKNPVTMRSQVERQLGWDHKQIESLGEWDQFVACSRRERMNTSYCSSILYKLFDIRRGNVSGHRQGNKGE